MKLSNLKCKFVSWFDVLIEAGVPVTFTKDGVVLEGFYKSGNVTLVERPHDLPTLIAIDRYKEETVIQDVQDIIDLNFDWWERSRTRGVDGWERPAGGWLSLFEAQGLVEKRTKTIYEPKRK